MANISSIRKEYTLKQLDIAHTSNDPLVQFDQWFAEALSSDVMEPNAMSLSTVDAKGQPHSRILLLKEYTAEGFVFYTNYASAKASEIAQNQKACMLFFWPELERQVRIEGLLTKVSKVESEAYFQSRPRASQLGAYASAQSQVIASKAVVEEKLKVLEAQFAGQEVLPLPDFWGGYRLQPVLIEFWQGRPSRLHDRVQYSLQENKAWKKVLLSP